MTQAAESHKGHTHGPGCSHTAVLHDGHTDYLHNGHLHHQRSAGQVDEHVLADSSANPDVCTPEHRCGGHEAGHKHGANCGHTAVPHASHTDYMVAGHLHHPHDGHCDNHGPLKTV